MEQGEESKGEQRGRIEERSIGSKERSGERKMREGRKQTVRETE